MSLLPSRGPDTSTSQEGELQVVGVDDDVAPLLDALNSETARAVLNEIYDDPGTPSEIADRLDMSIQKVSYHIDKLEDQELIAVAGTQYSEKGQEMTVYQPPEDPTVLFVGTQDRKRSLRTMVKRLLPVIGILALGSLAVQRFFGQRAGLIGSYFGSGDSAGGDAQSDDADGMEGGSDDSDGGDGADGGDADGMETSGDAEDVQAGTETDAPTAEPQTATRTESGDEVGIAEATETPEAMEEATGTGASTEGPQATDTPTEVAEATETPMPEPETTDVAFETTARATEAATSGGIELSPGLAFFLGGLSVVVILLAWWGYTEYA